MNLWELMGEGKFFLLEDISDGGETSKKYFENLINPFYTMIVYSKSIRLG